MMHWAVGLPLLTLLLTLHSSLCHELIHGHPTGNQTINNLLGYPPLALIFPYTIFRETHLKHHRNEDITYPGVDPESFFCTEKAWMQMGQPRRWMAWVNMTLAGRMLMGPGTCICLLAKSAVTDLRDSGGFFADVAAVSQQQLSPCSPPETGAGLVSAEKGVSGEQGEIYR